MSELTETPPPPIPPQNGTPRSDWPDQPDQPDLPDWSDQAPRSPLQRAAFSATLDGLTQSLHWEPFALAAQLDAWHPGFPAQLRQALLQAAGDALPTIGLALQTGDLQRVLRNTVLWAQQAPARWRLGSLALASGLACQDPDVRALAKACTDHVLRAAMQSGIWVAVVQALKDPADAIAPPGIVPRLFEARDHLTDSARVRLKLAWLHWNGRVSAVRAIKAVSDLPGISWQTKSRELRRFLQRRHDLGRPLYPLQLRHCNWLSERELRLLVRRPELMEALIDSRCQGRDTRQVELIEARTRALLDRFPVASACLRRLRRAIHVRHWRIAAQCIDELRRLDPPRPWIALHLQAVGCADPDWMDQVPDMDPDCYNNREWVAMDTHDAQWLRGAVTAATLERMKIGLAPELGVDAAIRALLGRRLSSSNLRPLEKQLLCNAMGPAHWERLCKTGRSDFLTDRAPLWREHDLGQALILAAKSGLGQATVMHRAGQLNSIAPLLRSVARARQAGRYPEALTRLLHTVLTGRCEMGKDHGSLWYLPLIGLPAWRTLAPCFPDAKPALTAALQHARDHGKIYNPRGFYRCLQGWNTEVGQTFDATLLDTWCTLARLSPSDAFAQLPTRQAQVLLADIDQCPSLLAVLPTLTHAGAQSDILVARAWRCQDPDALWSLLTHPQWRHRLHRSNRQARAPAALLQGQLDLYIAFIRQDPHALKQLGDQKDPQAVSDALWRVAARLHATHPRDAAFLQLLALLGVDMAARLASLLWHIARPAGRSGRQSFGHALDALYTSREIPKRNGQLRTLHIPSPLLKCVQKRIAQRVLDPLGAHDSATGFVRQRNVAENAAVHAHQPVVATCDIQACFPSVPPQRVWHALRRDLDALQPAGVSPRVSRWLAQICCAHGGLPVGAPSSPALLNRVLLSLDVHLSEQAQARGCRYTRYADDLCFSGGDNCIGLIGVARRALKPFKLALDAEKTNVFRRGRRQMVTGLCVNAGINIPRQQRRLLRAAAHRARVIALQPPAAADHLPKPTLNGTQLNEQMLAGHLAWHAFIKGKRHAGSR